MLPATLPRPSGSAKIFLYAKDVDMRKSFDGLHALVQEEFQRDVRAGDLFLFLNRRLDRVKLLQWDEDGMSIWMKELESDYPHFFLFTGIGNYANNLARRSSSAGRMDSVSAGKGPRRRPMSRESAVTAPPRAQFAAKPSIPQSCGAG
jgi:IS66 Orf2 like protein